MFWIGSYWREDEADTAPTAADAAAGAPSVRPAPTRTVATAAIASVLVCAVWPLLAALSDKAAHNPAPVVLDGSNLASRPAGEPTWSPEYMAADATLKGAYTAAGAPVDLNVLYYRNQGPEKRLISSVNRVDLRKQGFRHVASEGRVEEFNGRQLALRETRVKGPQGNYLVWHWHWVDGRFTANDYLGKLWQAKAKLMMHGDDGALLMIATPVGEQPEAARAALRAFLQSNLAPLQSTLEATRER
ncbi:exosortase C-terminal domain/associated protein EpsI [Massilia sp. Se16.2.3]|uniref:exosortase C-terminal domain/associated protein EpsI n=1 Tax=Massilia sp. Se16.2.3 TaxID=2709303 RepID=UPI001E2AE3C5|nr:exosortase C-terminal domain/associated protein EpsI [Massilia sp. Se16.2.3]